MTNAESMTNTPNVQCLRCFFAVSLLLWYSRPRLFFDVSLWSLLFLGCLFTIRGTRRQGHSQEQPRAAVPQQQRTRFDMSSMTLCALFYHFWQVKFSRRNRRFFNLKMFANAIGVPAGACRADAKNRPAWHGICMAYMAMFCAQSGPHGGSRRLVFWRLPLSSQEEEN
jgi:hypothetical protein